MTFSQGKFQHNTKENVLTLHRGGRGRAWGGIYLSHSEGAGKKLWKL